MKTSYEPSFLISVEVPKELHDQIAKYAKTKGVTEEQAYQEAVRFFSTQCVHTQGAKRRRLQSR